MTKKLTIFSLLLLLAPYVQAQDGTAGQPDTKITIGEKFSMHSEILGEERAYWVYLPASYDDAGSQGYPVMYILDGDGHFQSATGVVQFMSSGINGNRQIPELIVVAIPNTNRLRDLTPTRAEVGYDGEPSDGLANSGGADDFLRFINEELFVEIESDYRTLPHRTFVGHSLGGLIALYALLDKPDMFQAYISIDPSMWWDEQILTPRAKTIFAEPNARRGSVYISQAHPLNLNDNPELMRNASTAFAEVIATAESPQLRTKVEYFAKEDHGSVPLISLYHGLLHVFDGYKLSVEAVANDPTEITRHYKRISDQLGISLSPTESVVNNIGYFLLQGAEDIDGAITAFEINVALYPESANVYDSLGEALMTSGNVDDAIKNYEQSLALDPDNDNAREQLELLRNPAN